MSKIAIVTDSTAYLPPALVSQYNLTIAPQVLIWGEKTYEDGVDIQPDEFYSRLKDSKVMPSTSQVTIASFHKIFTRLLDEGYGVLAMLLSSKLSGTISSAVQAKEMLPGAVIEIIDTNSIAMALGFQVLTVARAVEQGASMEESKALAGRIRDTTGVVFAVETLEFLRRGGRIGGGAAFLATALNIKPILELRDGRVEAAEKVRTRRKSMERLVEIVKERAAGKTPLRLATLHANAEADARELLAEATAKLSPIETVFTSVSPVVGSHAGPGTVGLAWMAGV